MILQYVVRPVEIEDGGVHYVAWRVLDNRTTTPEDKIVASFPTREEAGMDALKRNEANREGSTS